METIPLTKESLRAAMRDDRYWDASRPEHGVYMRWVADGWQGLSEAAGGRVLVNVRAQERIRDGHLEHVSAYVQSRQKHGHAHLGPQADGGRNPPITPVAGPLIPLVAAVGRWLLTGAARRISRRGAGDEMRPAEPPAATSSRPTSPVIAEQSPAECPSGNSLNPWNQL